MTTKGGNSEGNAVMLRLIAILAATLVLGGCVTTREYVYTDGSYRDGYRERVYADGSYPARQSYTEGDGSAYTGSSSYVGGGTYYSSGGVQSGDYYYSSPSYYASSYYDYPYYYSIFQPINRLWYDPYYFPNYYYGVTFYPRNYFGFGIGLSYGWPRYGYGYGSYYSPYRYGWVDNYYHWEPWYSRYPNYRNYYPPRYGNPRREQEGLASYVQSRRSYPQNLDRRGWDDGRGPQGSRNDVRRVGLDNRRGNDPRGADYGSRSPARQDPGMRGFGVPTDVRRTNNPREAQYGSNGGRQLPSRGFGVPTDATRGEPVRGNDIRRSGINDARGQSIGDVRRTGTMRPSSPMQDGTRGYQQAPMRSDDAARAAADRRGYDLPTSNAPRRVARPSGGDPGYMRPSAPQRQAVDTGGRGYGMPTAPSRGYGQPQQAPRDYSQQQQAPRGYSAPPQQQAPARQFSAPPQEQRSYSPPPPPPQRPSFQDMPRNESRGEPRMGSGGRDGGGVRRVGRDER